MSVAAADMAGVVVAGAKHLRAGWKESGNLAVERALHSLVIANGAWL